VGARAFVTDSFSIDPLLVFEYATGTTTYEEDGTDFDVDMSGFYVGPRLSLSGWM